MFCGNCFGMASDEVFRSLAAHFQGHGDVVNDVHMPLNQMNQGKGFAFAKFDGAISSADVCGVQIPNPRKGNGSESIKLAHVTGKQYSGPGTRPQGTWMEWQQQDYQRFLEVLRR